VVKYREALINNEIEENLYKYITGVISKLGHKLFIINGTSNHIHILISLSPNVNISDLAKEIKRSSTNFINESKILKRKFQWQNGFGAFSYSHSHIPSVIKYIKNQKIHHQNQTFREEYLFDWLE